MRHPRAKTTPASNSGSFAPSLAFAGSAEADRDRMSTVSVHLVKGLHAFDEQLAKVVAKWGAHVSALARSVGAEFTLRSVSLQAGEEARGAFAVAAGRADIVMPERAPLIAQLDGATLVEDPVAAVALATAVHEFTHGIGGPWGDEWWGDVADVAMDEALVEYISSVTVALHANFAEGCRERYWELMRGHPYASLVDVLGGQWRGGAEDLDRIALKLLAAAPTDRARLFAAAAGVSEDEVRERLGAAARTAGLVEGRVDGVYAEFLRSDRRWRAQGGAGRFCEGEWREEDHPRSPWDGQFVRKGIPGPPARWGRAWDERSEKPPGPFTRHQGTWLCVMCDSARNNDFWFCRICRPFKPKVSKDATEESPNALAMRLHADLRDLMGEDFTEAFDPDQPRGPDGRWIRMGIPIHGPPPSTNPALWQPWEAAVAVDEDHRRRGIARTLMQAAIQDGLDVLSSEYEHFTPAGLALSRSLGRQVTDEDAAPADRAPSFREILRNMRLLTNEAYEKTGDGVVVGGPAGVSRERYYEDGDERLPRSDWWAYVYRDESGRPIGALEVFAPYLRRMTEAWVAGYTDRNGREVGRYWRGDLGALVDVETGERMQLHGDQVRWTGDFNDDVAGYPADVDLGLVDARDPFYVFTGIPTRRPRRPTSPALPPLR